LEINTKTDGKVEVEPIERAKDRSAEAVRFALEEHAIELNFRLDNFHIIDIFSNVSHTAQQIDGRNQNGESWF
jgi:hypothetical protein